MRRAALRGCALLLRRSGSAASEPQALLAAGLQAAAAGGPDVLQQLGAPSWQVTGRLLLRHPHLTAVD